jgi:hypothetical protein
MRDEFSKGASREGMNGIKFDLLAVTVALSAQLFIDTDDDVKRKRHYCHVGAASATW